MVTPISLAERLARFDDHWNPRIIADLHDHQVKLSEVRGVLLLIEPRDTRQTVHEYSRI